MLIILLFPYISYLLKTYKLEYAFLLKEIGDAEEIFSPILSTLFMK